MAGYRRVNYYELCRLCTSSEGTKMHIFREEGRRRSLPNKIQTCLPLQVMEEDSLPKIICSSCVEKLESFYEFRESCINAEAMLESYFTSLKYSDDLTREGKVSVYVKDEPQRKKEEVTPAKPKTPVSTIGNVNGVPTIGEGNAIIPSAIQIVTDPEGNRLAQYKVQLHNGIPSLISYGDHPGLPINVSIPTLAPHLPKQQITTSTSSSKSDEGTQTNENEPIPLPQPPPLLAAVALTSSNQEFFQQLGLSTKDRNALSDYIKVKNINILDQGPCESVAVASSQLEGQISGQVPNIIPAQIRLDQNQINQLISSNYHINFHQLQSNQKSETQSNKTVTKNLIQTTQNQGEPEVVAKVLKKKDNREEKTSHSKQDKDKTKNLSTENSGVNSVPATVKSEPSLKFNEDGMDLNSEELEETNEGTRQGSNYEEHVAYGCDSCSKTFRRREHLYQHKKSHSGERPFACTLCTKAFSRKEHLVRHHVSHTGQKIHTCEICQKCFSRKDNLHKHKKSHGIGGPHTCEVCGKFFAVKHYYKMHKVQHHESANDGSSLGLPAKHLITTTSLTHPLPHKCDLCHKSFYLKSYLTSHRKRHRSKNKEESEEQEQEQEPEPEPEQEQEAQQEPEPQQQEPEPEQHESESQEQESEPQQHQLQDQNQPLSHLPQNTEQQSSSDITIPDVTMPLSIPQPTILTTFPAGNINLATLNTQLATINPGTLLASNLLQHSGANLVQIGNNSYLCSPNVTTELLEQYRRIHSS